MLIVSGPGFLWLLLKEDLFQLSLKEELTSVSYMMAPFFCSAISIFGSLSYRYAYAKLMMFGCSKSDYYFHTLPFLLTIYISWYLLLVSIGTLIFFSKVGIELLCMYSSIINRLLAANHEAGEFRNLTRIYSFSPASLSCDPLVKPNEASPVPWILFTYKNLSWCRIIKCCSSLCLFPTTLLARLFLSWLVDVIKIIGVFNRI